MITDSITSTYFILPRTLNSVLKHPLYLVLALRAENWGYFSNNMKTITHRIIHPDLNQIIKYHNIDETTWIQEDVSKKKARKKKDVMEY